MKKTVIAALATCVGLALGASAVAADQTLAAKHGATWPKSINGYVTKDQCLKCHGPYDALASKTASLEPNPHFSHLGAVNCEDCHKAGAAKPTLDEQCNTCHQFTIRKKEAK